MLEKHVVPFQAMQSMISSHLTEKERAFIPANHFPLAEDSMAAETKAEIEAFGQVHAFLADRCWTVDPSDRARSAEVTAALNTISQTMGLLQAEEEQQEQQSKQLEMQQQQQQQQQSLYVDTIGEGGVVGPLLIIDVDDRTSFQAVKDRVRDQLEEVFPDRAFKKIQFVSSTRHAVPTRDMNALLLRSDRVVCRAEEEYGAGAFRLLVKLEEGMNLPSQVAALQKEHRQLRQQHRGLAAHVSQVHRKVVGQVDLLGQQVARDRDAQSEAGAGMMGPAVSNNKPGGAAVSRHQNGPTARSSAYSVDVDREQRHQ
jgi:uncharacterized protein YlxW (UPF0749 family)